MPGLISYTRVTRGDCYMNLMHKIESGIGLINPMHVVGRNAFCENAMKTIIDAIV